MLPPQPAERQPVREPAAASRPIRCAPGRRIPAPRRQAARRPSRRAAAAAACRTRRNRGAARRAVASRRAEPLAATLRPDRRGRCRRAKPRHRTPRDPKPKPPHRVTPPQRKSVADHVAERRRRGSHEFDKEVADLGQRVKQADQQFDDQLQAEVRPRSGHAWRSRPAMRRERHSRRLPTAESPAAQIAAMLANPDGVRQAIDAQRNPAPARPIAGNFRAEQTRSNACHSTNTFAKNATRSRSCWCKARSSRSARSAAAPKMTQAALGRGGARPRRLGGRARAGGRAAPAAPAAAAIRTSSRHLRSACAGLRPGIRRR